MKRNILLIVATILATLQALAQIPAQVTVRDDAKVGVIVTGTGNTINTTQIFGKSPEYAELKKRLDDFAAAIAKKADECEQMAKDNLPAKYRDNCRTELIALNAERDSVQKIEAHFREDVIRLAESFSKIELKSERIRLAKALFDEGKIRESDYILNAKEMKIEGDALLSEKARAQDKLHHTDSLLHIKSNEFALKATLKLTDYTDSLRYDSALIYFEQSRRYAETVDNFKTFADVLYRDNLPEQALKYYEKGIKLSDSKLQKALLHRDVGISYASAGNLDGAEKSYKKALKIIEKLQKENPDNFNPDLATVSMNLGNLYHTIGKEMDAEKFYSNSLKIFDKLAKDDSARFTPDLALLMLNMSKFYRENTNMPQAGILSTKALSVYRSLAIQDPVSFEPYLAHSLLNAGTFYEEMQDAFESEKAYSDALEIYEKLAAKNPMQFQPDVALCLVNLGNVYVESFKFQQAFQSYKKGIENFEHLYRLNPLFFKEDLALSWGNISWYYLFVHQYPEAQAAAERALTLDSAQNWVRTNLGHAYLLRSDWSQAKIAYEEYLKNEPEPAAAKKTLAKDWDDLEAAGITSPAMAKARAWVKD